jgi:hypothetical protein
VRACSKREMDGKHTHTPLCTTPFSKRRELQRMKGRKDRPGGGCSPPKARSSPRSADDVGLLLPRHRLIQAPSRDGSLCVHVGDYVKDCMCERVCVVYWHTTSRLRHLNQNLKFERAESDDAWACAHAVLIICDWPEPSWPALDHQGWH